MSTKTKRMSVKDAKKTMKKAVKTAFKKQEVSGRLYAFKASENLFDCLKLVQEDYQAEGFHPVELRVWTADNRKLVMLTGEE